MKIIVCVKHVPDTAATIKIAGDSGYEDSDIKFVANPYDEHGIEEAVSIVEKQGGEVVILTVGKAEAVSTIRSALAMGAHRAILVKTETQFLDSSLTAKALKSAIEQDGLPDIIFTGKGSVDTESFQTQYRLARSFDIPIVNEVSTLNIEGDKAVAQRETGGGEKQVIELSLPCVIGATKGLNEPRYPKFPDIMKAKKKEIKEIELSALDIDSSSEKVSLVKLEIISERSGAKILEGSVDDQVNELINILKEKEKVI
ncbi:MAG: electron transfer flavoprotein subunit beta/FixA family protein [Desulfobacula sp.]|jgi:electron transfer flavoprotein beta subunit|uniref:electron transfer flavoprotein subunit beta/FixA family protein n=3 Tax=Desulfobacula sp. TaxID=2593537 RepID=UPI001DBF1C68|nr:electron transfer flavoprotein subunit beta/FixA family protein [Desulfobacula sp.]MBT5971451.1 electron transfer flavoprotein subunit beta/FixA family protein [Desulfobacula sp.]MBT7049700.1 electron transfer flavoprotein subunit beta/FixA family protein [Desulfobacula sp.]